MHSEKEKIPKDWRYPLRASFLSESLSSAGIDLDTHLIQSVSGIFFDTCFWPPNPNVPYERLYVRVSAVPTVQWREARTFIESIIIPELIAWVQEIVSCPAGSPIRGEEQYISWELPSHIAYLSGENK